MMKKMGSVETFLCVREWSNRPLRARVELLVLALKKTTAIKKKKTRKNRKNRAHIRFRWWYRVAAWGCRIRHTISLSLSPKS